jgi:hypothetical protein
MTDDDTQARGPNGPPDDAETTVDASETSTVDRAELAWSTEPETGATNTAPETTEPIPQHGRAVSAGLVVLVCATAVAGTWFAATLFQHRQSNSVAPAQVPPMSSVVIPPPPPVTVTAQPPAPTLAPTSTAAPPLTPQEQDSNFLASLGASGIFVGTGDAAQYAIEHAHSACGYLATHTFDQTVDHVERTTIYNDRTVTTQFLYAATTYYCANS